jgi:predicted NodU family carbamoyl transferase
MSTKPLSPLMVAVLEAIRADESEAQADASKFKRPCLWNGANRETVERRVGEQLGLDPGDRSGTIAALLKKNMICEIIGRDEFGKQQPQYLLTVHGRREVMAA